MNVSGHRARVRKAQISAQSAFDAYLAYYPPGLSQPEHEHGCSQFSVLLAGSLVERVEGREHEASPGQVSAKPKGIVHADGYGPQGAILLSFQFRCEDSARAVLDGRGWHWRLARAPGPAIAFSLISGDCASAQDDLFWDILTIAEQPSAKDRAPDWLRWVRSELDQRESGANIGDLAAKAGVHRVHLSRQFVRHFGLTPSAYRGRQMAGRALRAMIDDKLSAAAAAYHAGFADQSHMARAIRTAFGTTPRHLTSLLDE